MAMLHFAVSCGLICSVCAQSCPTFCSPMDFSPPGSSVHGIFQARILEQVAISFPRESFWARYQTFICCISCIGKQALFQLSYQIFWVIYNAFNIKLKLIMEIKIKFINYRQKNSEQIFYTSNTYVYRTITIDTTSIFGHNTSIG